MLALQVNFYGAFPINYYFWVAFPGPGSEFVQLAEGLLYHVVAAVKVFLEGIAISIVVIAAVRTLLKFLRSLKSSGHQQNWVMIRLDLGLALALSLEFLLAADIVSTAVSPSWDDLGKLATVTGIRTFLNFFLHKEVDQLEAKTHPHERKVIRGKKTDF
ncbi:DUF1622 domain-containing protein [Myxosarcina sp. GI1]|uniref:DUF1622 domain-containing protein n=1 Tax=Myxosarcina sp. GI1 TaxID=1541065 RepID=UPI00068F60F0|nr:DUF1622 domain-containing protein [Myxosarcina sp. GI1]